MYLFVYLLGR